MTLRSQLRLYPPEVMATGSQRPMALSDSCNALSADHTNLLRRRGDFSDESASKGAASHSFWTAVASSPDGKKCAVGCMSGNVAVFDLVAGTLLKRIDKHTKPVRALCFSADSRYLLVRH